MRSLEKPRELWTVSLKVRSRSFFISFFIIVVIIIISFIIIVIMMMLGKTFWLVIMIKKNCDLNEIGILVLFSLS